MKTDMQLHQEVLTELMWDPRLGETEIGVGAKDGVVTLAGSVSSYADKLAAEHATQHVAGVTGVTNDLVVALPAHKDGVVTLTGSGPSFLDQRLLSERR